MPGRYRASMCKSALDNVESGAPELFAKLPTDRVAQIRAASRADWLPALALTEIYEGLMLVGGEDVLETLNRAYTRNAMSFSVFGPLVKGATNLFGGGPRGLLRVLPNSWDLMTRDCGSLSVEFLGERRAQIVYADLAPELRTRGFVVSSAASPMGILDALDRTGSTEIDDSQFARGRLVLNHAWSK